MSASPSVRVTKMVCPCCLGTNEGLLGRCDWCRGAPRVSTAVALRYADVVHMLAGGGYIAGDNSYEEMIEREKRAERIYELAMTPTPWPRRSRSPLETGR